MTVSATTSKLTYSGNGSTTVFAYTFYILDDDDILVQLKNTTTGVITTQTKTTHYTVSGVGVAAGGNITFLTAPASGNTVVLSRNMTLTQETDYNEYDTFPASSHETALDKAVMIDQQLKEGLDRAIKFDAAVSGVSTTVTGTPASGNIIAVNSSATGLEYITVASTGAYSFPAGTGVLVQTAANTATVRTNTGTTNRIAVTNGSGVSGNPTFDIDAAYAGQTTITTLGTVTTGTWGGTTIAVANGGTGQTTYTNGQLLIGNTTGNTLAKATLTAGTGISITNGTGSITVNNTGVTSVAGAGLATGTVTTTGSITVTAATSSDQETATSSTTVVTPSVQHRHPSASKFWIKYNTVTSSTVTVSYNVSSLTDNGTGSTTVNLSTSFSSANWNVKGCSVDGGSGSGAVFVYASQTASSVTIVTTSLSTPLAQVDSAQVMACGFGDQ